MKETSEILAALKALQTHIGGQIQATNRTLREFVHSMDSRFSEVELRPKTPLYTNSGKFGFENYNGETEIFSILRAMKMDVPKFDGTDQKGWISRVEEFFDFYGTPDRMRLQIVSFHMEGRAAAWFEWTKVNNLLTTWPEFIVSFKNRLCSFLYNDSQGLLSRLTQTSTVLEFQPAFEDLIDKEGSELKCSKLVTKAEIDDRLIGANGLVVNDSDCKMGTITNHLVQIEAFEKEKVKTLDAYFANGTPLLHSLVDITPTHSMLANEEKENKRISEVADLPLIIQEFGEGINCVVEQLGMVRQYKAHIIIYSIMARRTIFKLYGLKEVYVDYLNLHLEDKVVLKGRRVDTTKKERRYISLEDIFI